MTYEDSFFGAYVRCALWASTDNSDDSGGDPLDKNYNPTDLAPETREKMLAECQAFLAANRANLDWRGPEQGGHDFWLTRNRHGCGFWDGNWPEPAASRLDAAAKAAGERHLYVGDDGLIYQGEG